MWECRELQVFWKKVFDVICELIGEYIPLEAKLCLLHIYPVNVVLNASQCKLIDFSLIQVKRVIAFAWKSTQRPCSSQWIKEMSTNLALEKLTYIIKDKLHVFNKIWIPFIQFVNK